MRGLGVWMRRAISPLGEDRDLHLRPGAQPDRELEEGFGQIRMRYGILRSMYSTTHYKLLYGIWSIRHYAVIKYRCMVIKYHASLRSQG